MLSCSLHHLRSTKLSRRRCTRLSLVDWAGPDQPQYSQNWTPYLLKKYFNTLFPSVPQSPKFPFLRIWRNAVCIYFAYGQITCRPIPLYFKASSPALEHNHHPIQLVTGVVFSAVKRTENEADGSPHMPSWLPQGTTLFAYYNPRPSIFI